MKTNILIISFLFSFFFLVEPCLMAQEYQVSSPDNSIRLNISAGETLEFSVEYQEVSIFSAGPVKMKMNGNRVMGENPRIRKVETREGNDVVKVQVPNKDSYIKSHYNQISLLFKDNYKLVFRVFNDGFAYRFQDMSEKSVTVVSEDFNLRFPDYARSYFPEEESMYSHNERSYLLAEINDISEGAFCSLPVLFDSEGVKILFTEASLYSYPCMFLSKTENNSFKGKFPPYVLEAIPDEAHGSDRNQIITREADYIASVSGARAYPWRVFIISNDDRILVESNLVTELSGESKLPGADWIQPGQVAWDWYNANNIWGVDFEAGLNMETYKYYIDFASKNSIQYVILDEGWTKSTTEIMDDNEYLDVPELIKYAKSKNVDIILWVLWKPLDENTEEILSLYSSWGAAGVKVDFMQRSDQYMVQSYEKIAEIAAGFELLVDYHGAFKPAGIERRWPNVINYEGVKGNENNKWSAEITPEHNVTLPFIRMAAGPMDFTPGSMINVNEKDYVNGKSVFSPLFTRPMSMGSRCHQVAMYVVYEAPLQMLCESPSIYNKEQETVDFITEIPTTWDETFVPEAAVSDYIIVARRKGDDWYIGAMTDWTPRNFELPLSFLGEGKYSMKSMRDGINVHRNAMDYKIEKSLVDSNDTLNLKLGSGGGWAAILHKQ